MDNHENGTDNGTDREGELRRNRDPKGRNPPQADSTVEEAGSLVFRQVHLHKEENRKAHNTDEYDENSLILRRGQEFKITITFEREYKRHKDEVFLLFTTGQNPQESKSTLIRLQARKTDVSNDQIWYAKIVEVSGKKMSVQVYSPADAIVGQYKLYVETKSKVDGQEDKEVGYKNIIADVEEKNEEAFICILFNPFCKDDVCYLENEEEREEYLLNETGKIWVGSSRYYDGQPWNFGQFHEIPLRAALFLLESAKLPTPSRSSPIYVTRCISKMANNLDQDDGVLVGRWASNFAGGTSPGEWNGSVAILEKYMKTKKPVKYGQCWVFSGIVTTLCRALGLATRSVTNFASAHDTDSSYTIDFHFNEDGTVFEGGRLDDSIWNFHVWNESWFRRLDLPEGHDGWQLHDATPQETSGGIYQCGPASVEAVKKGEVYLSYDTGFAYGEVNGDKVHWTVKQDRSMEADDISPRAVGKMISTTFKDHIKDITDTYKPKEGTKEEREAMRLAYSYGSRKEIKIYKPREVDVKFKELFPERVQIGKDVKTEVEIFNTSRSIRTVRVTFSTSLIYYTGVPTKNSDSKEVKVQLQGGEKRKVSNIIEAEDFLDDLIPGVSLRVYAIGHVEETKQHSYIMEIIQLEFPKLVIKAPRKVNQQQEFEFTISFTNTLPRLLTRGKFAFEANNMRPANSKHVAETFNLYPNAEVVRSFKGMPKKKGKITIVADFISDKLGAKGSCDIEVI